MRTVIVGLGFVIGIVCCQSQQDSAPNGAAARAGATASGGAPSGGTTAAAGRVVSSGAGGRATTSGGRAGRGGTSNTGGSSGRAASAATGGSAAGDAGSGGDSGSGGELSGGGSSAVTVGEWTDAPGECPPGSKRVDITTLDQMQNASRGDSDQDATCFFVHDGTYAQTGSTLPLYFLRGGTANAPVVWVGESRSGVVIQGRATFEIGSDHMQLSNMTLDISKVTQTGAYDTITVLASDITLSHLTLTGDCAHGSEGGHIEVPGLDDPSAPTQAHVVIDSCLIEKFGHCASNGSLDHGIYLSSGDDIVVRNSVIRGNSSRGIQIYTHYEDSSLTLTNILIERNRIESNGHGDYQDGMVVNGNVDSTFVGPIDGVTIKNNVFRQNYYSAIRFVGNSVKNVEITHNTFVDDGAPSTGSNRSELNLDDGTPAATATKNLFVPVTTVVNSCVDSLGISDNVVSGGSATGSCVMRSVEAEPQFVDAANGDFHTQNPAVDGYGAYAP
jgi:hypothetical protein